MLKKIFVFLCLLCSPVFAETAYASTDTYSVNDLLKRDADQTPCAKAVFEKALADNAYLIENPDEADSAEIETWTHLSFNNAPVLQAVLDCPEVKNAQDTDTIIFETVGYTFPNGRLIEINYETQKSVLKQKLLLTSKPDLSPGEISPDIVADAQNGVVWVNVDPAWYGILVAEHGTMDEFVQPGKTNVVALKHIENNIKTFYPKDHNTWPVEANCTSKTAMAEDADMINRATTRTVGAASPKYTPTTEAEKEQEKQAKNNDYYVLGDGDLTWISALEIVADVVMTVVSWGGYAIVKGALTALRGTKAFVKANKALKALRASHNVARYLKVTEKARHVERAIKNIDNVEDTYKTIKSLESSANTTVKALTRKIDLLKARNAKPKTIKAIQEELEVATKQAKSIKSAAETADKMHDAEKVIDKVSDTEKTIANIQKQIDDIKDNMATLDKKSQLFRNQQSRAAQLENNLKGAKSQLKTAQKEAEAAKQELEQLKTTYKTQMQGVQKLHADDIAKLEKTKDVMDYKELAQARRDIAHTVYLMRRGKVAFQANRGLLPMRAARAANALRKGFKSTKKMDKAIKVVRANTSGISAKINDWLFHNTMKNITAIAKVNAKLSTLTTVVKIAGDMYDVTSTSTGDFTNNIEMKPYLLLGADNLPEYENVVNHGMWLFWAGSSTSAADDDAAYLQAMSFAEKFHQDLVDVQDEYDNAACDVDIYVVRPIIRNPGTENAELYYLIMNDTPWTTHDFNNISSEIHERGTPLTKPADYKEPENASSSGNSNYATAGNPGNLVYYEPAYDGSRIGQGCTPPSASAGVFPSTIYSSGRYSQYPAFEKAMITKFRTEGECVNHPADAGKYTCYGVSSRYFPQVKTEGFNRNDAEDIAYKHFFHGPHIDRLPDAISGDVFMALWGTGSRPASIGLLQNLLGVEQTNAVDEATIEAAKNYQGDLRTQYLDRREQAFRSGQKEFRQGWLNAMEVYRANGCHTVAQ